MSIFNGEVTVQRALLINGAIGIEAKGSGNSTAEIHVDQTTIANVNWGVRAFDKDSPDPDVKITYDIVNSVIDVRPGGDAVFTDYDPADLHIIYQFLRNSGWATGDWDCDSEFTSSDLVVAFQTGRYVS